MLDDPWQLVAEQTGLHLVYKIVDVDALLLRNVQHANESLMKGYLTIWKLGHS
nr:hypothetical protein [uncultured Pseudomonas sp.]